MLLDGVVGEMHKLIGDILAGVLLSAESQVALLVAPHLGWIVVAH